MTLSARRIAEIVQGFSEARVAVAGDFMADVYLEAEPSRLSREAPVMIATWQKETTIPGGAANALNNLLALGATAIPVGIVGDDDSGRMLQRFFRERDLEFGGVVMQKGFVTTSKMRVMLGEEGRMRQQVLRIDREPVNEIGEATRVLLQGGFEGLLPSCGAVLFSDYGYKTIDAAMIAAACARRPRLLVAADSRYDLPAFRGVDVITPNNGEAAELGGSAIHTEAEAAAAAARLQASMEIPNVVITRGNQGMLLAESGEAPFAVPASGPADEVTDVSGAGDTVVALITLARVAGASWREAVWLANVGAGVVVAKLGAATVSPEELMEAATSSTDLH